MFPWLVLDSSLASSVCLARSLRQAQKSYQANRGSSNITLHGELFLSSNVSVCRWFLDELEYVDSMASCLSAPRLSPRNMISLRLLYYGPSGDFLEHPEVVRFDYVDPVLASINPRLFTVSGTAMLSIDVENWSFEQALASANTLISCAFLDSDALRPL
jgi:hypothetical protein